MDITIEIITNADVEKEEVYLISINFIVHFSMVSSIQDYCHILASRLYQERSSKKDN
jgi:hypothetical protein